MRPIVRSAAVLAALGAINVLARRGTVSGRIVGPVGVTALLLTARASGLTWTELGVDPDSLRRDLRRAGAAAALTGATVTAAATLPGADAYRSDERFDDPADAWRASLLLIPLTVAIPEEIAFRGVLEASLRRHLSPGAAAAVGALAFGAWHVLGARDLSRANAGVAGVVGSGLRADLLTTGAVTLATGAAGLGFLQLRRRSGSVLPGMAAHWALNAAGALAAADPD